MKAGIRRADYFKDFDFIIFSLSSVMVDSGCIKTSEGKKY